METKPRVLIVDDSMTVRMDLRAALTAIGFAATACGTREAALMALMKETFHLVILDVDLPDGSGIELLREIKKSPELRRARVFMLATRGEVDAQLGDPRLHADLYFGKSYNRGHVAWAARQQLDRPEPAGSTATLPAPTPKSILIVDGSPTFLNAFSAVLRIHGHRVERVHWGEDAIELAKRKPLDCVLLDLTMPSMDGLQTCKLLRALPGMARVRIVVMAASSTPELKAQAAAVGANDVVIKRVDLELMCTDLNGILNRQHGLREVATCPIVPTVKRLKSAEPPPADALYRRVLQSTGLGALVSRSIVDCALDHVGGGATTMTPEVLRRALPHLRQALRVFLPCSDMEQRLSDLAKLGDTPPGPRVELPWLASLSAAV